VIQAFMFKNFHLFHFSFYLIKYPSSSATSQPEILSVSILL
jgi:hypothetical protein